MMISIIVAIDEAGGIGIDNQLPWKLSADLKRLKQLTMGHHIIMGRKTFESIGKPLPGRHTIIITRNPAYQAEGCLTASSVEAAVQMADELGEAEVFIFGGASIYTEALPMTDRIYLTRVHTQTKTDIKFPKLDLSHWIEKSASTYEADENNQYATTFKILERQK
jgi:dihydrofolate reductase